MNTTDITSILEEAEMTPAQLGFSCVIALIAIIALWVLFQKAGEPGWKSIIPIYGTYTLFKIVTGNGWKFLLLLIPIFNIIYAILFNFKMAKAYGKSNWFGLGLLLLSTIFLIILAFGDSKYRGPA